MKFSPVLYRFFDFFSLSLAFGKSLLFKHASSALLPEEDDSFYIFLAGLFSRIMSSRIVRLMLSDDLKLSGDGAWMVSEGFLIVWVMASFLDEVSTSRFDALRAVQFPVRSGETPSSFRRVLFGGGGDVCQAPLSWFRHVSYSGENRSDIKCWFRPV
ncbi:hypothetical protein YC2023_086918 [Brassica napus]